MDRVLSVHSYGYAICSQSRPPSPWSALSSCSLHFSITWVQKLNYLLPLSHLCPKTYSSKSADSMHYFFSKLFTKDFQPTFPKLYHQMVVNFPFQLLYLNMSYILISCLKKYPKSKKVPFKLMSPIIYNNIKFRKCAFISILMAHQKYR